VDELQIFFVPPFANGWQDYATSVTLADMAPEPMLSDTLLVMQREDDRV